mgnify:FL=1
MLNEDIIEKISENLCIYDYNNVNKYKLISKNFKKCIEFYMNKFDYCNERLYMATQIKQWRPELDQIEYIYNNFMIFDDYNSYLYWKNNSKTYHNSKNSLDNEVISCNLFQFTTLNKNIFPEETNKISSIFIDPFFIEQQKINISKLLFDTYFIYYFVENYNYCYGISFIILPYFDKRLLELKIYHSYNIVKKNILHNHNIIKIKGREF